MTSELVVLHERTEVARLRRTGDRVALEYAERWRAEGPYPLSLSLPLASRVHAHEAVEAFLWNLLPDNDEVLERWGRRFGTSARDPFCLLEHVGEDCAGAFAFVRPERVDLYLETPDSEIDWLDEADVAERLRVLKRDVAAWRLSSDTGQFSLAGAQPKLALLRRDGRWGVPSGSIATTHILKPPAAGLDGHAQNEHFCLRLTRALGNPAATTGIERFEDEVAIVVERYDRVVTSDRVLRVHQEDLCQALGIRPHDKYQRDGGPTPAAIADLLRAHSARAVADIETFRDALALQWLIAGTDAHGKNYSLLHQHGSVRLAPLYDVASALGYEQLDVRRLKLAMKLGGTYCLADVRRADWEQTAGVLGLDRTGTLERIRAMAAALPEVAREVRDALPPEAQHEVVDRLTDALVERARICADHVAPS